MNHVKAIRAAGSAALVAMVFALGSCGEIVRSDGSPSAPALSTGARDALLEADRAEAAELFEQRVPGEILPEAEVVRAVSPLEWAEAVAACMTEAGFPSTPRPDTVESQAFPAEQDLAHAVASYVCRVEYPIDPVFRQTLTADEADYLYGYLTGVLIPCLEDQGHQILEVPSRGKFKDEVSNDVEWSPYLEVMVSGEPFYDLLESCPAKPRGFRGY